MLDGCCEELAVKSSSVPWAEFGWHRAMSLQYSPDRLYNMNFRFDEASRLSGWSFGIGWLAF